MKIVPIIYGGGQQKGMRSGTDNVPGIAGLGLASKMVYDHLEENDKHMRGLRTYFVRELAKMDQVVVHGPQGEEAAPQIVSAAFVGVRSEVLLHTLEGKRYLRIRRKCLLYAQKKWKSYTDSYWTAEESDGSNRSVQLL